MCRWLTEVLQPRVFEGQPDQEEDYEYTVDCFETTLLAIHRAWSLCCDCMTMKEIGDQMSRVSPVLDRYCGLLSSPGLSPSKLPFEWSDAIEKMLGQSSSGSELSTAVQKSTIRLIDMYVTFQRKDWIDLHWEYIFNDDKPHLTAYLTTHEHLFPLMLKENE